MSNWRYQSAKPTIPRKAIPKASPTSGRHLVHTASRQFIAISVHLSQHADYASGRLMNQPVLPNELAILSTR